MREVELIKYVDSIEVEKLPFGTLTLALTEKRKIKRTLSDEDKKRTKFRIIKK